MVRVLIYYVIMAPGVFDSERRVVGKTIETHNYIAFINTVRLVFIGSVKTTTWQKVLTENNDRRPFCECRSGRKYETRSSVAITTARVLNTVHFGSKTIRRVYLYV